MFTFLSLPLELHAVHCNSSYNNLTEAFNHYDGIAIVVYLFESQFHHNPEIHRIVSSLVDIRVAETFTHIEPFSFTNLLVPFNDDYFMYMGPFKQQYKTPVRWMISRKTLGISLEQLSLFQLLYDKAGKSIGKNYQRPILEDEKQFFHVNPKYGGYPNTTQCRGTRYNFTAI